MGKGSRLKRAARSAQARSAAQRPSARTGRQAVPEESTGPEHYDVEALAGRDFDVEDPARLSRRARTRLRWLGEVRREADRQRVEIVALGRRAGLGWDEMSAVSGIPRETLRRWSREQPSR